MLSLVVFYEKKQTTIMTIMTIRTIIRVYS